LLICFLGSINIGLRSINITSCKFIGFRYVDMV
jgi:hypothetical protein